MKKIINLSAFMMLLLFTLLAAQCTKGDQEQQLPPITTHGLNTFGCRVNGEVWIPERPFSLYDPKLSCYYNSDLGGLNLAATKKVDNIFQSVTFSGRNIWGKGEFEYNKAAFLDFDSPLCDDSRFLLDTTLNNKFTILRLDTENRIISGTFEFTAVNDECDPVVITDGRFDVQY